MPVEVILRMPVVKRFCGWSYTETEKFVSDSLILRQLCWVYLERFPDDTRLNRWPPVSGRALWNRLAHGWSSGSAASGHPGAEAAHRQRLVESNVSHPIDSRLLGEGVRVLPRLLRGCVSNETWSRRGTSSGRGWTRAAPQGPQHTPIRA